MHLDELHIGASPLTDRIYLGTVSDCDRGMWSRKVDFTDKFIGALMALAPRGAIRTVVDSRGNRYEIQVRKLPAERAVGDPGGAASAQPAPTREGD